MKALKLWPGWKWDAVMVVGCGAIVCGAYLTWPPLAWFAGGLALLAGGIKGGLKK